VREGASDAASGVDSRQKAGTDLMAGRAALRSVAASMAFDILGMRRPDTKQMVTAHERFSNSLITAISTNNSPNCLIQKRSCEQLKYFDFALGKREFRIIKKSTRERLQLLHR
jgi:hypothetical protein